MNTSRRRVVELAALSGASAPLTSWAQAVAKATGGATELQALNRFPRMVHEAFVARVRAIEEASLKTQAALATRTDAEAYVAGVRKKIRALFGPQPPRTPLRTRVTGRLERDAYTIEKITFESRPGLVVTADVYVPKGPARRRPAVLGTCGHSDDGKAAAPYQSFAQALARLGYVTLIYDPIGQGERLQYATGPGKSRYGIGVREHLQAGNQQFLVGEFFGAWRAWDGIRALDVLLARPDVDPRHIGVTGNSGGGTLTTWLCALDDRITMAAPACFVTTFRRNIENELPADTEQCPPGVLAAGIDHADFIAALAPKPVVLLGRDGDFFDARGTVEAHERLKRIYRLLGAADRIAYVSTPGPHEYAKENREAMYRWFNRWTGASSAQAEPALTLNQPQELCAAPSCLVAPGAAGPGSTQALRTVFSFTKATAETLAKQRRALSGDALARAVKSTFALPDRRGVPPFRILRPLARRGHPGPHTAVYAVETEPGIQALVYRLSATPLLSQPPAAGARAILYIAHMSSDRELATEPLIAELLAAEPETPFFACDVRGIGESQPDTCGRNAFLDPYGSDYFYAIHSIMLGRPYLGQRTHDVLAVTDWLASYGHKQIHLVGRAWGSLPAAFAALLSPAVTQVTLKHALTSYTDVATSEAYDWPLGLLPPGVLRTFDLPACYAALGAKKLRQIEPRGAAAPKA